jgi:hypothetical protein
VNNADAQETIMSGFLFPHMSQGPSDFYMARGKLSANGVGNWNNATALAAMKLLPASIRNTRMLVL